MKRRRQLLASAILLSFCFVSHLFADDRYIVRVQPSILDTVARQYGLKVEKKLKHDQGLYLVSVPQSAGATVAAALKANPLVQGVETNSNVSLPELSPAFNKSGRKVPSLKGGAPSIPMAGAPWIPYVNQAANSVQRIQDAQKQYGYGSSGVVVAVIDTGVDYRHPVLAPVLNTWDAKNFITGTSDASLNQETTPFVDQETTPFVDGSGTVVLNQETTPFVDQETTPFVDQETTPFVDAVPPAYGHGTMVAGIVHLVAPNVRILPLKAFKSDGSGTIADVIEAIDYAVQHGVQVINMSFSAGVSSPELNQAIAEASAAGVICVASVANEGLPQVVYPSNIQPVIGVGATTIDDYRAGFSNYGSDVDIAAPGVAVISTYPQNRYAAGWGTSFSTPYVAGTVALMRSLSPVTAATADQILEDASSKVKSLEMKAGRLDVFKSLTKVR
jgi:subtilisin family serine protease